MEPLLHITHPGLEAQPRALAQAEALLSLPGARRLVLTPDLHPGPITPVGTVLATEGTVVPSLPGADIGCGMQLHLLPGLTAERVRPHMEALQQSLRARFFQGQREVRLDPQQRLAVVQEGCLGVLDRFRPEGLWKGRSPAEMEQDVSAMHNMGSWPGDASLLRGWIETSTAGYCDQLGTLGGSNHFCEIGTVSSLSDGAIAHAWGVRQDALCVLVHSGSRGFGHLVSGHFDVGAGRAPEAFPLESAHAQAYLGGMHAAANLATLNRWLLARMAVCAMQDVLGEELEHRLIGDTPHNLIWEDEEGLSVHCEAARHYVVHRKGATPAWGPSGSNWTGEPVLIPGSMGTSSHLMAGLGKREALSSTAHGAGRALSRRRAQYSLQGSGEGLIVVLPVDLREIAQQGRPDLASIAQARLAEEAPDAYKDVELVIQATQDSGAANPVARLTPLLTVKGF